MIEVTIYPAWQETIRKGQAYVADRERQEAAEREAQDQAAELEEGKQLKRVLALFGIEADPTKNECIVGDFAFSFGVHPGTQFEQRGRAAFHLTVSYAKDGYKDDDPWALTKTIYVNNLIDDDWSKAHADLANVIDKITQKAPDVLARIAQQVAPLATAPADALPMSISDTLVELMRKLIREQVGEELDARQQ